LISERKKERTIFLKKANIVEELAGEVTLDVNVLSKILKRKKCHLRKFFRGRAKLLISSADLEQIVNLLVQSRIDEFIHQLDSHNITLAELYRMNKRL
jgi:hypothetical protein